MKTLLGVGCNKVKLAAELCFHKQTALQTTQTWRNVAHITTVDKSTKLKGSNTNQKTMTQNSPGLHTNLHKITTNCYFNLEYLHNTRPIKSLVTSEITKSK
jgi:hypothetical protein